VKPSPPTGICSLRFAFGYEFCQTFWLHCLYFFPGNNTEKNWSGLLILKVRTTGFCNLNCFIPGETFKDKVASVPKHHNTKTNKRGGNKYLRILKLDTYCR
jgi:hypothetical protein